MIVAAEKVTDAGYKKVEAYAPFAVIGIDEALKAKKTILPWIVFCMGLSGCLIGITMQCYMNGMEGSWWLAGYEFLISGKPFFSIPAFIPVTFELTILLSAFGAFFGMLATTSGGRLVASPGGLLIFDAAGQLLGAIGVSGDLGEHDEACAAAGIVAAALHSERLAQG